MDLSKYSRLKLEALVYRHILALEHTQNAIKALNDEIAKRPPEDILPDEQAAELAKTSEEGE